MSVSAGCQITTREQVEILVDEIVACNPNTSKEQLLSLAEFDTDNLLLNW